MRNSFAGFACVLLGVAGLLAVSTLPADARRGGGGVHAHAGGAGRHAAVHRGFRGDPGRHVNRNVVVNRNINRTVNRRYVQRNGRWGYWRNGVWVAAPLAAVGSGYVATCAYEYNRWKSTGSAYWRDRYYKCAG